ncbi:hypothetical protein AVEN_264364-1 [Araneus ventricosus]|uniref:PiggyBac transposable element-derived protein domain-containing protein n=1 Tax=Araneus ventricosus TaxID=182803 RepID=A0A4Y2H409_ARAVE|nr:hypothetical protein AVEN_264364-1 [Araneus ventricosus]
MYKSKRFSHATKSLVQIARSNSVRIYNLHMGGVDLMDSLVTFYCHSQRNKRWYLRIFLPAVEHCCSQFLVALEKRQKRNERFIGVQKQHSINSHIHRKLINTKEKG